MKQFIGWYYQQPALLMIIAVLCWSANTIVGQLIVDQISPAMVVFARWFFVTALLWPLFGQRVRVDWPLIKPKLGMIVLMASLGLTVFNALFYAAAHTTGGLNIGILQGSMPIFVLVGSLMVFRTKVTALQGFGSLLGLIGVIAVATEGRLLALLDLNIALGDGLMIVACLLYSSYALAVRNRPAISGLSFFTLMAPIAMLTALPLVIAEGLTQGFQWPTTQGWLFALSIAIFPSCIAQIFFLRAIDLIGPGSAGGYMNLTPVIAAIMSVAFLGESFHSFHAVALALVIGGTWLVHRY